MKINVIVKRTPKLSLSQSAIDEKYDLSSKKIAVALRIGFLKEYLILSRNSHLRLRAT